MSTKKKKEEINIPAVHDESSSTPLEVMKKYYGHTTFRPMQEEVINSVLNGNDTVCFLATGTGKSLVLKVPALIGKNISIIISPILALMADQITNDVKDNIASVTINSSIGVRARKKALQLIKDRKVKIVYAAPETLLGDNFEDFRIALKEIGVDNLLIDEAHTCSQWSDFRTSYTKIHELRLEFPEATMLAVTATADEKVLEDIVNHCGLKPDYAVFRNTFDRPNIHYNILYQSGSIVHYLTGILDKYESGTKGVIYCQTRAKVDDYSRVLKALGYNVAGYHAGMTNKNREIVQSGFKNNQIDIIVCSSAFGMGIDVPNIRFVVMADCPDSFEALSQGWGRGGRDGLKTDAYMIYHNSSYSTSGFLIRQSTKSPQRLRIKLEKLKQLHDYCTSNTCRRAGLLAAFSEKYNKDNCESCDVCISKLEYGL